MTRLRPAVTTILYTLLCVLLVMGTYSLSRQGYRFCRDVFGAETVADAPGTDISFLVEKEDDFKAVAARLEKQKIIADKDSFYIRTKLLASKSTTLLPGEYTLNNSMTYEEIIDMLTISEGTEQ
jgi:cell division protein YceG involved in septum cleavage